LSHLNEGGFIMVDNTLWSGKVLEEASDKQTTSIKEHNQKAADLEGHIKTLLPIRDGIFLIQKC
jgi:predicted O-methyltransferase YrrM